MKIVGNYSFSVTKMINQIIVAPLIVKKKSKEPNQLEPDNLWTSEP